MEKDSLQKAAEFWDKMKVVEASAGSFETKDGSVIGVSSVTYQKEEIKTEDIECEVVEPKQIENNITPQQK